MRGTLFEPTERFMILGCKLVLSAMVAGMLVLPVGAQAMAAPVTRTPVAPAAHAAKAAAPAAKKARRGHKASGSSRYHYKTYFVPPPPAYMPSMVPGLMRHTADDQTLAEGEEKKPENPYKKYIYTPEGSVPAPIQTRKGVVFWANRT